MNNAFHTLSSWHRFFYIFNILIFDLAIFYYFYSIAIPKFLQKKRIGRFVLFMLLIVGVYPFVKHMVDDLVSGYFPEETSMMSNLVGAGFWQVYLIRVFSCLFVIMMGGIGKFTFDWFKNMKIRAELETQNLTSELAFLKSQINPHFLFNTLNNIHTLAYKKSDLAPDSIMQLSELMRYMIYESDVEFVPLDKEIVHLRSFIDLQTLRFKSENIVDIQVNGDSSRHEVAPLLLLPFVENAFKHGSNLNRDAAIRINLDCKKDGIHFEVINDFNHSAAIEKDNTGGIGLENIRRRLELIYKDKYTFDIDGTSGTYHTRLSIYKHE